MYSKSFKVIELYNSCKAVYEFVYHQLGFGEVTLPTWFEYIFQMTAPATK